MGLHDSYSITSWFKIQFLENEGMAYGITIFNKLFLTSFRIIVMSLASYLFYRLIKQRRYSLGYLSSLALVVAGGIGNIIDCIFYGKIFTESSKAVAQLTEWGQGYGELFYGKVVDMLYFPMIETTYPDWLPFIGGEHFIFFAPVFNIADSCISVGVFLLIVCYRKTFTQMLEEFDTKRHSQEANNKA